MESRKPVSPSTRVITTAAAVDSLATAIDGIVADKEIGNIPLQFSRNLKKTLSKLSKETKCHKS